MYIKTIVENYCLKTIQYLLFVYMIKMYYKVRIYKDRIELEFYTCDEVCVYVSMIYLTDDYIPNPDVLACKIYTKLMERECENNE